MKSGDLREFLEFLEYRQTQSPSGAVKKEWVNVYKCRGMIKKKYPTYDKDGVDAKELYRGNTMLFSVRKHKSISDSQRVRHNGRLFEIILITPVYSDNSLLIQVKRIND